jgi:hypothetical protein
MCSMMSFSDCHFAFHAGRLLFQVGDPLFDFVQARL